MFFSAFLYFPSRKGPFWFLALPRIMSHSRTGLGSSGWGGGGYPVAGPLLANGIIQVCLEFRGGNAIYWY